MDITVGDIMQTTADRERTDQGLFVPKQRLATLRHNNIVADWLKSYKAGTQNSYLTAMDELLADLQTTPQDLVDLLNLSPPDFKHQVKRVIGDMLADDRMYAAKNLSKMAISFASHNDTPIKFSHGEHVRVSVIKTEYVLRPEEVYDVADVATGISNPRSPRNKALIKTDWVTALRRNALSSLRCGAIEGYSESDCPIPLRVGNEKQEIGVGKLWCIDRKISSYGVKFFYTFIAKEAFLDIQEWLAYRKKTIGPYDPKDYLFGTTWYNHRETSAIGNPLAGNYIWTIYNHALRAVGIDTRTTTFHKLRDAWKSVMIRAEADPEVREAMMAHKMPGSGGFYFDHHDVEMALAEYVKADWGRAGNHKLNRLEQRVDNIEKTNAVVAQQAQTISIMQAQMDIMKDMMKGMFTVNMPRANSTTEKSV